MKKIFAVILAAAVLPVFAPAAWTQSESLDDLFARVSPSVVVVRSKGRDVSAGGVTNFSETGSGVLISSSGRVMTAAHVVNGMDEITVEGIGGEVVRATIISANSAADVSLLQLERVTKAMRVARMGSSAAMQVGQQVTGGLVPLISVFTKRAVHDVFDILRQRGRELSYWGRLLVQDGTDRVYRRVAVERQFSRKHFV